MTQKTQTATWREIAEASNVHPPTASWVQAAAEAEREADKARRALEILREYAHEKGLTREYAEQIATAQRWERGWRAIARRLRMDFGGAHGAVRVPINPNSAADRAAREAKKAERRRQDAALRAAMKGKAGR
jgi:hypothetical protein